MLPRSSLSRLAIRARAEELLPRSTGGTTRPVISCTSEGAAHPTFFQDLSCTHRSRIVQQLGRDDDAAAAVLDLRGLGAVERQPDAEKSGTVAEAVE